MCESRINTLLNYLGNDCEWRHRVIWIQTHIKSACISNDIEVFNDSSIAEKSRFILRPTVNANTCMYTKNGKLQQGKKYVTQESEVGVYK